MNKKNMVLLGAMLKSTSLFNRLKYSKDKKIRGKIISNVIGLSILYIILISYSVSLGIGYGAIGMADSIPSFTALAVASLAFLFTLLKTNGYLFQFKEYDMLMALPYEPKTIAACKFIYMYIKSMPWYVCISLPMMVGYGVYAKPSFLVYLLWIVLSLFFPVIPMLIAAFIGFLFARISANFKKTNIVQTLLMLIFILFAFSLRYIIEALFRNNEVEDVMGNIAEKVDTSLAWYPPAVWFSGAIQGANLFDAFLLIVSTVVLFVIVFELVGRSYRQINSALKSHAHSKAFKLAAQKKSSVVGSIAFKEFKRFLGSSNYMVNCGMGEVLAVILGVAVLFVGLDRIVGIVTNNAPIPREILNPAIPLIVYFLIGMVATTTCSPSLEGKNYWIVQSLPVSKKALYQGKMLFNMYLSVPFSLFATLCMSISAGVSAGDTILYLIESFVLCAFSTTWGCVCGIRFMKLEWENELEVIKQGAAVVIYLFPNMFITMGMVVLVVILGMHMNTVILTMVVTLVVAVLAVLSYAGAMKLAQKQG